MPHLIKVTLSDKLANNRYPSSHSVNLMSDLHQRQIPCL